MVMGVSRIREGDVTRAQWMRSHKKGLLYEAKKLRATASSYAWLSRTFYCGSSSSSASAMVTALMMFSLIACTQEMT